jgi:plasmid stability protein
MKRTTLALDDDILAELKLRAAREGRRVQQVANDVLRHGLQARSGPPYRLKLRGWKAKQQPGVDILDRDKLFDLLDGRS